MLNSDRSVGDGGSCGRGLLESFLFGTFLVGVVIVVVRGLRLCWRYRRVFEGSSYPQTVRIYV